MSHLHLPDGLVPVWLWAPALLLVLGLIALGSRALPPQRVAYQGALGGLMLAAMSIPLGPLEYHLTLAGPVGVLLGPAAAFPVVFVVSAILAFLGHGGLTVVGLNTLVLGAAAAVARAAYGALVRRLRPAWAMALASAVGQGLAGVLWIGIVVVTLRSNPEHTATLVHRAPRLELMGALALTLWIAGTLVESVVAYGVGRFLARVYPGLLPEAGRGAPVGVVPAEGA